MNYVNLIVFVGISLILIDKFFFKLNPVMSNPLPVYKNKLEDIDDLDVNIDKMGFVKPEHRLFKILNSVSSGSKIKLNGKKNKYIYNKNTISTELNDKLTYLVKDIISSLNKISSNEFYVKKIENVYITIDSSKNQRYIIDFFIYDVKNYYSIRLISDIAIINEEIYINYLNVHTASTSHLINKYDIKFNSIGILFDSDMFHEDIIKIFDNYYSESFHVIGIDDSTLDYTNKDLSSVITLNSFKNSYLPANISNQTYDDLSKKDLSGYLEMYLPENQNLIKSPQFCNKYSIQWDKYGIEKKDNEECYLNNNQTTEEFNKPWFGPGVIYDRSSNDEYKWLKDPGRKNIIRDSGF